MNTTIKFPVPQPVSAPAFISATQDMLPGFAPAVRGKLVALEPALME